MARSSMLLTLSGFVVPPCCMPVSIFFTSQVSNCVVGVSSQVPGRAQMPAVCSFGAGGVCGHCQSASEHVWAAAGQAGDYSAVWLHA